MAKGELTQCRFPERVLRGQFWALPCFPNLPFSFEKSRLPSYQRLSLIRLLFVQFYRIQPNQVASLLAFAAECDRRKEHAGRTSVAHMATYLAAHPLTLPSVSVRRRAFRRASFLLLSRYHSLECKLLLFPDLSPAPCLLYGLLGLSRNRRTQAVGIHEERRQEDWSNKLLQHLRHPDAA